MFTSPLGVGTGASSTGAFSTGATFLVDDFAFRFLADFPSDGVNAASASASTASTASTASGSTSRVRAFLVDDLGFFADDMGTAAGEGWTTSWTDPGAASACGLDGFDPAAGCASSSARSALCKAASLWAPWHSERITTLPSLAAASGASISAQKHCGSAQLSPGVPQANGVNTPNMRRDSLSLAAASARDVGVSRDIGVKEPRTDFASDLGSSACHAGCAASRSRVKQPSESSLTRRQDALPVETTCSPPRVALCAGVRAAERRELAREEERLGGAADAPSRMSTMAKVPVMGLPEVTGEPALEPGVPKRRQTGNSSSCSSSSMSACSSSGRVMLPLLCTTTLDGDELRVDSAGVLVFG